MLASKQIWAFQNKRTTRHGTLVTKGLCREAGVGAFAGSPNLTPRRLPNMGSKVAFGLQVWFPLQCLTATRSSVYRTLTNLPCRNKLWVVTAYLDGIQKLAWPPEK